MQPDPTVLDALADRVEAGEEGREMDMDIYRRIPRHPMSKIYPDRVVLPAGTMQHLDVAAPPLTCSLDAIEAARERLLPECTAVEVYSRGRLTRWFAEYSWIVGDDDEITGTSRKATTERHARLAALLRAYAAKMRAEGGDHA